jgi:8-oxo-dGTP pyrophosphatase MutT (NUDIX family)
MTDALADITARVRAGLAERQRHEFGVPGFTQAAVLVPIVESRGEPALLFTVRRAELKTHAGQISFPGGKRDADDDSLEHTALRETHEELGIAPDRAELLGRLDEVPTPAGYMITPVVATLRGALTLVPSEFEVADVFSVGITQLLAGDLYVNAGEREWQGVHFTMHEYHAGEHRIWGATARMVFQLLELLR